MGVNFALLALITMMSFSFRKGQRVLHKFEGKTLSDARMSIKSPSTSLSRHEWTELAQQHRSSMERLLYPDEGVCRSMLTLKERRHAVDKHPIYNFLHTYYRYSAESLMKYSPGTGVQLLGTDKRDFSSSGLLHPNFFTVQQKYCAIENEFTGKHKLDMFRRNHELLRSTIDKQPLLSCYGLHEWAMLYRGHEKHQKQLGLRVSQETIDRVVEEQPLRCTHYDAYRFFSPDAKPLNAIELDRAAQLKKEQPGCIHATMDLFKYAYMVYPLVSSHLLRDCLKIAFTARYIDMRASPYAVHAFEGCEYPISVETEEGRALYAKEQEALLVTSKPIRTRLLAAYDVIALELAMAR
jgi:hypothetical protein